jgi:hypothetical protein
MQVMLTSVQLQGDSGGMVNTLGGDSIGNCDKKKVNTNVTNFLMITEIQLFESTNTKAL